MIRVDDFLTLRVIIISPDFHRYLESAGAIDIIKLAGMLVVFFRPPGHQLYWLDTSFEEIFLKKGIALMHVLRRATGLGRSRSPFVATWHPF